MLSEFAETFVPSVNEFLNAWLKERCRQSAVQDTEERLIAPRYVMQISAYLVYIWNVFYEQMTSQ